MDSCMDKKPSHVWTILRAHVDGRLRRLRGMIRLTLGRMFEATVRNRSHELVLKKEVTEAGGVNANVAPLLVASRLAGCEAALSCGSSAVGGRLGGLDLLVGVVDEVLLVRHDD
jgi:hypothetical protein